MIVIQPELEQSWKALANAIEEDIYVAVHLTLKSGELENTKSNYSTTSSIMV